MNLRTLKKGFTLIELLIVITIIGILAVALLPSVLGAPARARDAARKADLNNIIAAIETYNSDNQDYPAAAAAGDCVQDVVGLPALFQGATAPTDAQGKGLIACSAPPITGSYFYCKLDGNPAAYLVAAEMEVDGDGTAMKTDLAAVTCDGSPGSDPPSLTDPNGTSPPYFVVIK